MEQMSKNNHSTTGGKNLLSSFKDYVIITSVYLYFIGWIFIHAYYDDFGVHLFSLDIPIYFFFVYSAYAVSHAILVWWIDIIAIAMIVTVVIVTKNQKLLNWTRRNATMLMVVAAIFMFVFLYFLSKASGKRCAEENRKRENYPTIAMVFKMDTTVKLSDEFIDANANQHLRMLTQTKDRYIVFHMKDYAGKLLPVLYDINKNYVYLTTIEQK